MKFVLHQPVTTTAPMVAVDGGLPPGRYRFRLQVVNARGASSQSADHIVVVLKLPTIPEPGPIFNPGPIIPIPRPGPIH